MKIQRGISIAKAMRHDHSAGRIISYSLCRDALGRLSVPVSFLHSPHEWPIKASVVASSAWTGTMMRPHLMEENTPQAVA